MKTALKITTAVALVMGGLLTGACGGQPLTDTRPSAFVEQFNQTTKDVFVDPIGLQFKKYSSCVKTGDGKKGTCEYSAKYASMELNTRESGSVWRAAIRVLIPKGDEREAYMQAVSASCLALFKLASGLSADDADKLWKDLLTPNGETSLSKDVEGIHYFRLISPYGDGTVAFCGAADPTDATPKDDIDG